MSERDESDAATVRVPREPTEAMFKAGYAAAAFPRDPEICAAMYRAMLSAAPAQARGLDAPADAGELVRRLDALLEAIPDEVFSIRLQLAFLRVTEAAAALEAARPSEEALKEMVDRFLSWPLPQTFSPDCGISFDGRKSDQWNPRGKGWPIGTNLLTANEAEQMLRHVLRLSGGGK